MSPAATPGSRKTALRSTPDWKETISELRQRQRRFKQVAKAIGLDSDSPKAVILREYLLSEVFRLSMEKRRATASYLQRLHALVRALVQDSKGNSKGKSRRQSEDLVQQLEQIYGPGVVLEEVRNAP